MREGRRRARAPQPEAGTRVREPSCAEQPGLLEASARRRDARRLNAGYCLSERDGGFQESKVSLNFGVLTLLASSAV